jgi:hypothetical protein
MKRYYLPLDYLKSPCVRGCLAQFAPAVTVIRSRNEATSFKQTGTPN